MKSNSGAELNSTGSVSAASSSFVSLYRDACNRKKGDPGFEPPPPPAGPRPQTRPPLPPLELKPISTQPDFLASEMPSFDDVQKDSVVAALSRPCGAAHFLSGIAAFDKNQLKKSEPESDLKPVSSADKRFLDQASVLIGAFDKLRLFVDPGDFERNDDETNWDD